MNDNPLQQGLATERVPEPCTLVIFGASGDLTRRKLVPALHSLATEGRLPAAFAIVGFARKPMETDAFREEMRAACERFGRHKPSASAAWHQLARGVHYLAGDYDDPEAYRRLRALLEQIDRERATPHHRIFYLSTPPATFPVAIAQLGAEGLVRRGERTPSSRVIIEKPFGVDLESARTLNGQALSVLDEEQVYRIDHYLGKETVQNLMVLRFANSLFEPLWNRRYVDSVQITGAESIGIEGRGAYFDHAGILRDMVQNHLFQVLAITAMEPPVSMSADDLRNEKVKVLRSLRSLRSLSVEGFDEHVVRGQYSEGFVGGHRQIDYAEEPGVTTGSTRETYVGLKLFIDNWRWAGVPFYLRAGKAMPKKVTEIALLFKDAPLRLFGQARAAPKASNVLAIRVQPDEGISLRFGSKVPGNTLEIHPVNMEFRYGTSFGIEPPEAYERLLLDCMLGDQALFTRGDEVEASWRWLQPLLDDWARRGGDGVHRYPAGTWGPEAADQLLRRDGHAWRRP